MNVTDAAATGALPGDTKDSDFKVEEVVHKVRPRTATNPEWYAAAVFLAPKDIGTTARRGWIEGFVDALDLARDVGLL